PAGVGAAALRLPPDDEHARPFACSRPPSVPGPGEARSRRRRLAPCGRQRLHPRRRCRLHAVLREALMEALSASTEHPQYLTFGIGAEEYALAILRVREIIRSGAVTRVPQTPGWVRGVTNLRGSAVPVIALAVKFGLPPSSINRSTCIVITEVVLEGESLVLGLVADEVSQ